MTFGERVFCVKENADRKFRSSTCISDVDERIRALVNAEFGYHTSGDKPRSPIRQDTRSVNMWRIQRDLLLSVSPLLDLGAGAGVDDLHRRGLRQPERTSS